MARSGNRILGLCGRAVVAVRAIKRRSMMSLYRPLFASCGKDFWFDPAGDYSFRNIQVGNHVFLGLRPTLSATRSKITIGDKVMFGPGVCIMGGNHDTSFLGEFMIDVTDAMKGTEHDRGVIIEDDVWVGARAVILHGCTIGRGCIVAAGSVVTRSAPPYSVVGGVPARVLKWRWTVDQIIDHEAHLYASERRLSVERLTSARSAQPTGAMSGAA